MNCLRADFAQGETHDDQKAFRGLGGLLAEGGVRNVVELDGPFVGARLGRPAGGIPEVEVFQYALDHFGVSDDAYDTHCSATAGTPEGVDTVDSAQQSAPGTAGGAITEHRLPACGEYA